MNLIQVFASCEEVCQGGTAGLPFNLADTIGQTLLMLASGNGQLETPCRLLAQGAVVDRRNDRGQTSLGGAAFKRYADAVALPLEHGANIDADNGSGMTAIRFASLFVRVRVAAQLQEHGISLMHCNRLRISVNLLVRCARFFCAFYPSGNKLGHQGRHTNTIYMKSRSHSLIAALNRTKCAQDLKLPGQFPSVRPALASGKYPTRTLTEALRPLAERAPFAGANKACDLKTMNLLADISRELDKLLWLLEVRQHLNRRK